MGTRSKRALPAQVDVVKRRIEEWRETREKRTRMPEDLWAAAVSLAREHGTWRVSQSLRVRYDSLRGRLEDAAIAPVDSAGSAKFVEVDASALVNSSGEATGGGSVVELRNSKGVSLTIRLGAGETVDIPALTGAFLGMGR